MGEKSVWVFEFGRRPTAMIRSAFTPSLAYVQGNDGFLRDYIEKLQKLPRPVGPVFVREATKAETEKYEIGMAEDIRRQEELRRWRREVFQTKDVDQLALVTDGWVMCI